MKDLARTLKQLATLSKDEFTKRGLNEIVSKLEQEDDKLARILELCTTKVRESTTMVDPYWIQVHKVREIIEGSPATSHYSAEGVANEVIGKVCAKYGTRQQICNGAIWPEDSDLICHRIRRFTQSLINSLIGKSGPKVTVSRQGDKILISATDLHQMYIELSL